MEKENEIMRKKSREIIAAVLFAAMVTGTFTGCKSSGSGSAGKAGTTLAQETVKEESTKSTGGGNVRFRTDRKRAGSGSSRSQGYIKLCGAEQRDLSDGNDRPEV